MLVASAAVLALAFQRWLFGDGAHLLDTFLFGRGLWMHVLYLPVARALEHVLAPVQALQAVSVLGGAVGTACAFLLARGLGATRVRALLAAGLTLTAPATWFFATTIEVHALHLAAVSVAAAAIVLAPVPRMRAGQVLRGPGWTGERAAARAVGIGPGGWLQASTGPVATRTDPVTAFFPALFAVTPATAGTGALSSSPRGSGPALHRVPPAPAGHGWRDWASVAVACAAAPFLYLTHKSGVLLAPGLVALAALARVRRGAPAFTRGELVLALGAVGAAFLASIGLGAWLVPENSIGATLEFVQRFQRTHLDKYLLEGVLGGLGLLLPLAVLGWNRSARPERLATAAWALPVLVFFTWFGESNRGAYFTALVPVLAVLAVSALPGGRAGTAALALATALQLALAVTLERGYAANFSVDEHERRVAAVRAALGEEGTVLTLQAERQPVTTRMTGIREINLRLEMQRVLRSGSTPEAAARGLLAFARDVQTREPGPMVLDASPGQGPRGPFTEALTRLAERARAELGEPAAGEPLLFVVR